MPNNTEVEYSRPITVSMWEDDGTEHEVTVKIQRLRAYFADTGWTPWKETPVMQTTGSSVTRLDDGSYRLDRTGARLRTRGQLPPEPQGTAH